MITSLFFLKGTFVANASSIGCSKERKRRLAWEQVAELVKQARQGDKEA
ncbi:hypothetical protein DOT_0544 [Desulfosporosinus sp. OT]|nr:hypothetical protein DOT_0544 [Desulfosporosinus sp. OT]